MSILDQFRLDGQTALVTGCKRGIGRAFAQALADAGADIVGVSATLESSGSEVEQDVVARGRRFKGYACDFADRKALYAFIEQVQRDVPQVDILVNNAGFNARKAKIWEITPQEWDSMFAVNLRGVWLCCREVLPGMIARQSGHIINVISTAAQIGLEQIGVYGATKWGLLGLTKSLIKEARPYNVRVTALSPGGTDTSFRAEARPQYLRPEAVAEAIVFVAALSENAVVHDLVMRPMVETNF